MINRFVVVCLIGLLVFPFVFGSSLFGLLDNDRTVFWPADINGEDINVGNLWALNIYAETITSDSNVVGDMNIGGDLNVAGSIVFGGLIFGDGSGLTGISAGSSTADTTLDSNSTADANWLGTQHSFTADQNFTSTGITKNIWLDGNIIMPYTGYSTLKIYRENGNFVINAELEDGDDTGLILRTGAEELIKLGMAAGSYEGIAMGDGTTSATGQTSLATGGRSVASGTLSTAMGYWTESSGWGSFAVGSTKGGAARVTASGYASIAMGIADIGAGDGNHFAGGIGSAVIGINSRAMGRAAIALGEEVYCYEDNQVCIQDLNVLGDFNVTNIQADYYFGDGSGLTGISAGSSTADTTLDSNSTADANWLGTQHSFTADQNFTNIGVSENAYLYGNLDLNNTTSSTTGVITKEGVSFIHNFRHPTGDTARPTGQNTFVGKLAGNFTIGSTAINTTQGSYNNAMGYESLTANTSGYRNNAMGYRTLYRNTTGYSNNAIGARALYSNTTGYYNNAVGYQSLYDNTTGTQNNASGHNSLYFNTTGSNNSAIGSFAMHYNTTGYNNSAIGTYSLFSLEPTSKEITAFADSATSPGVKTTVTSVGHGQVNGTTVEITGTTNYQGSYVISNVVVNTFDIIKVFSVNDATGWWGIDSEGRNNIAIGSNSGRKLTTGSSNIFLGSSAGYKQTTNDNLLIVDNQLRASTAVEATNAILYGVMAATPADQTLRINADLNVTEDLDVDGNSFTNTIYGEMYVHTGDAPDTVSIPDVNVFYHVQGLSAGLLNGVAFQDNNLVIQVSGVYAIDTTLSFAGGGNSVYDITVGVNHLEQSNCYSQRKIGTGGNVGNTGSNCLLSLVVGDKLTILIEDEQSPPADAEVHNANLTIKRIGN